MFLAAVARPRYDLRRRTYFDGKLGIWPIVERVQASHTIELGMKPFLI
ncbi:hypothetical protein PC128_g22450 [Phytophthora cactorum]|nr:hypothetical protein PC128_g22450 [Phytophthora cactorum]